MDIQWGVFLCQLDSSITYFIHLEFSVTLFNHSHFIQCHTFQPVRFQCHIFQPIKYQCQCMIHGKKYPAGEGETDKAAKHDAATKAFIAIIGESYSEPGE